MKTLTVEEDIWLQLQQLKLKWRLESVNCVIKQLLKEAGEN